MFIFETHHLRNTINVLGNVSRKQSLAVLHAMETKFCAMECVLRRRITGGITKHVETILANQYQSLAMVTVLMDSSCAMEIVFLAVSHVRWQVKSIQIG